MRKKSHEGLTLSEISNLKDHMKTDFLYYVSLQKSGCTSMGKFLSFPCGGHYYTGIFPCPDQDKSLGIYWLPHRRMPDLVANPDHIVFHTCRNPFDWLVSYYFHGKHGGHHVRHLWNSFEDFAYAFNSDKTTKKSIWHLSERKDSMAFKLFNREGMENGDNHPHPSKSSYNYQIWPLRFFMGWQVFEALKGTGFKKSYATFHLRFEYIKQGLNLLDLPAHKYPHANKSALRKKDYRSYYNDKLIEHIYLHRKQDFELFGYDFDGPLDENPLIKTTAPFFWDDDRMKD